MVCGGLRWFAVVCGGLSYSYTPKAKSSCVGDNRFMLGSKQQQC